MHSTLEYIQQFYKLVFHKELKKKPKTIHLTCYMFISLHLRCNFPLFFKKSPILINTAPN